MRARIRDTELLFGVEDVGPAPLRPAAEAFGHRRAHAGHLPRARPGRLTLEILRFVGFA